MTVRMFEQDATLGKCVHVGGLDLTAIRSEMVGPQRVDDYEDDVGAYVHRADLTVESWLNPGHALAGVAANGSEHEVGLFAGPVSQVGPPGR